MAPRNPDLEARIKKLKAQQERKDYEKMTDNVDPWRKVELVDRIDKPISKQCKYHIVTNIEVWNKNSLPNSHFEIYD